MKNRFFRSKMFAPDKDDDQDNDEWLSAL